MNFRTTTLFVVQPFAIVIFAAVCCAGQRRSTPADAIFLFQKISVFLGCMRLGKVVVNTGFAGSEAAAVGHGLGDFIVGDERRDLRHFGHRGVKVTARHGILICQSIQLIDEAVSKTHQTRDFLTGRTEFLILSQHRR